MGNEKKYRLKVQGVKKIQWWRGNAAVPTSQPLPRQSIVGPQPRSSRQCYARVQLGGGSSFGSIPFRAGEGSTPLATDHAWPLITTN